MKKRHPVLTLIAATLLTASAHAEPPPPHGPAALFLGVPVISQLDTNGDGKVSDDEKKAFRTNEFLVTDSNSDSSVSLDELTAWQANRVTAHFVALDMDLSTLLSVQEFTTGATGEPLRIAANLFALADTDKNGGLTSGEFSAIAATVMPAAMRMAAQDTNSDGLLSQSEYVAAPMKPLPPPPSKAPRQAPPKRKR